jgi:predicted RNA-binding Zn ribbon-like protein
MKEAVRTLETLEIVGGALCLDFANTVNSRPTPEHDYLMHYSDLVGWANKLKIISPAQTKQIQKRAGQNTKEAQAVLEEARKIRELVYRLLSPTARGSKPLEKDMEAFVSVYGEAVSRAHLIKDGNHFRTIWNVDESFDALLWPIIHSAGELLLSKELGQVKECPSCGWLFLDTSKNQSRRWCSMNTCGARDKMRRYHKRQRAK